MSETTVVDARLDKLEQDNRRLKLTVGALLLALAAVPLVGAVMPERVQDAVFARAFYVEDENGTQWLTLVYTVTRGNLREYVWVEQLEVGAGASIPSDPVWMQ